MLSISCIAALATTLIHTTDAAGYAPNISPCPSDIRLVRDPRGLSKAESDWVFGHKPIAAQAFAGYLSRLNLSDFDTQAYTSKILSCPETFMPTIALANSGGGWRSAFTGTGGRRAMDDALPAATRQKTGGLLQSATHFGGLSGGSWPVSSYTLYGYPAFDELVDYWHVNVNRFNATTYSSLAATAQSMFLDVVQKFRAGFNVSASDYLGRAFSYEFVPGAHGGINSTWSGIVDLPSFKNFSRPMPLLQTSSIVPGVSPFNYGVYTILLPTAPFMSGRRSSLALGTRASRLQSTLAWLENASNGTLGSFVKRSDTFDHPNLPYSSLDRRDYVFPLTPLQQINDAFNQTFNLSLSQISDPSVPAAFLPNHNVTLTDDSEAGMDLPFFSLIRPARGVDFVMAWDDDSDSQPYGWVNGTTMHDTYLLAKAAGLPFPAAPPATTFLARNYALRPAFFGCNASLTTTGDIQSPMVIYMSNAPYSWYSNFSWSRTALSETEFRGVLQNSFDYLTQGNGTLDSEFVQCIGCAAVDRSLERMGMGRTAQCERCFATYCWDGTEDAEWTANDVFDPSLVLNPEYSFTEWVKTHPFSGFSSAL